MAKVIRCHPSGILHYKRFHLASRVASVCLSPRVTLCCCLWKSRLLPTAASKWTLSTTWGDSLPSQTFQWELSPGQQLDCDLAADSKAMSGILTQKKLGHLLSCCVCGNLLQGIENLHSKYFHRILFSILQFQPFGILMFERVSYK